MSGGITYWSNLLMTHSKIGQDPLQVKFFDGHFPETVHPSLQNQIA